MDDQFSAFNAEQRGHDDDLRRRLDFDLTLRCRDCGRDVPYGQMAVSGCPECDDDIADALGFMGLL